MAYEFLKDGFGMFKKPKPQPKIKKAAPAKKVLASKVIIVYSGKGGVGKTTTTANIAKTLEAMGKRTMIIDMDVNTPSMPVVFPEAQYSKNLLVESIGYEKGVNIYVEATLVRRYMKDAIKKAVKFKPEYILIDTPPSVTDVHINLIKEIKISGMILVTQPNELSKTDVFRTVSFFQQRGVHIVGIVENMTINEDQVEYPYGVLGRIPFSQSFNFNDVFEVNKPEYEKITTSIENLNDVVFEETKKQILNEEITLEDVYGKHLTEAAQQKKMKFINCSTWDDVRHFIEQNQFSFCPYNFLMVNTGEKIKRLVEAFEEDNEAFFMITNAPNTEIPLFPTEIGKARLVLNSESYYGVPRISYKTTLGDVILFPHEVIPADKQMMNDALKDGAILMPDGRCVPSLDMLHGLNQIFGSTIGILSNYEEKYKETFNL